MKTYVTNKDTIKKKLAYGAMYLGTAIVLLRGCDYLTDRRGEIQLDRNADEVTELIEEKKFGDATDLANDFNNAGLLRESDYISLSNLADREEKEYQKFGQVNFHREQNFKTLNESIENGKENDAWNAFKSLDSIDFFTPREEDSLKIALYKISDKYILNKYGKGDPKQKLELGEQYLQSFPDGDQVFMIANYIIGKRADILMNNLMFEEKTSRVMEDFTNLNNALGMKIKGVDPAKFISMKGLDSLTNAYIFKKTYEKRPEELKIGDVVAFVLEENWYGESAGYPAERKKMIPLGTRGTITRENKLLFSSSDDDTLHVQFNKLPEMEWKTRWEPINEYCDITGDTDNMAAFLRKELRGIPHMSASQVDLMKKHLNSAKVLMEEYIPKIEKKPEVVVPDTLSMKKDVEVKTVVPETKTKKKK